MNKPVAIVIGGPTASGKTTLAIALAKHLNTEIVSADSRQVYKELSIGVARPSASELAAANHHFIASHSLESNLNAGTYAKEALPVIEHLLEKNGTAIVCGGTGLYINAIFNGMDEVPETPASLRMEVEQLYQSKGLSGIVEALKSKDPMAIESIDVNNPARVKRALEIVLSSNKPLSEFRKGSKKELPFDVLYFYLNPDRALLYQGINQRCMDMMDQGFENEAKSLIQFRELPVLKTIGYAEIFQYIDGTWSKDFFLEKFKQHTRNYAKRQLTWFRNQNQFVAISKDNALSVIFAALRNYGYSIHE
ncbi:MAG: tRNA (adenosine(37)-N6)-dimethylallyltransferase MiaA [Bacteroidia bacterium]|nr:tRNA (adenosine(37)-N6)-dimethylallyltransferase MiaA [Bacteroidia bacterium]